MSGLLGDIPVMQYDGANSYQVMAMHFKKLRAFCMKNKAAIICKFQNRNKRNMEELIETLRECRAQLTYLNEKFPETGTTNAVLAKVDNVLNNHKQ